MAEATETIGLMARDDPDVEGPEDEAGEHDRTIVLLVFSPRHPDPKPFRFPLTMTVGEAAAEAAEKFGYEGGTPTFKRSDGTVLDRDLTLRRARLRNREKVELVDVGGGV